MVREELDKLIYDFEEHYVVVLPPDTDILLRKAALLGFDLCHQEMSYQLESCGVDEPGPKAPIFTRNQFREIVAAKRKELE